MAPSRRTAPKIEAPQTLETAMALIAEYRDLAETVEELNNITSASIASIQFNHDAAVKPLEIRAADIFLQLRAWWAVAAPELTHGKRKSVPLAGCTIGERTSPPALKLRKIKMAQFIEKLLAKEKFGLLRITHKLDKPAAIKALQLGDDNGRLLSELGAAVAQGEEFFIDWPRPKTPDLSADLPADMETAG